MPRFQRATGWRLEYTADADPEAKPNLMWSAPVNPGVGTSPGHIRLFSTDRSAGSTGSALMLDQATPLAGAVARLWGELLATRHALWLREAELAVGVPLVISEPDESRVLGERLEAVLKGGAEATGCDAAALYVLDPATTELKLRTVGACRASD